MMGAGWFRFVRISSLERLILFLLFFIAIPYVLFKFIFVEHDVFKTEKIIHAERTYLTFESGGKARLIAVYIPASGEPNYDPSMQAGRDELVLGKEALVVVKLAKHKTDYPKNDLVEVIIDGQNINKELLKRGLAFFNEDYWKPGEKEKYRLLEKEAQDSETGVWKNKRNLLISSIRHKNWKRTYPPTCWNVQNLKPSDKIVYYHDLIEKAFRGHALNLQALLAKLK